MNEKLQYVLDMYPHAKCELIYSDMFTLLVAIVLSAQTTDAKVNKVTPTLFAKYKNVKELAQADYKDVEKILQPIGMNIQKSRHIIDLSKILVEKYDGKVIPDREFLITLPGVGNKTINALFAEGFKIPAMPVDTHIHRIAKRFKLVPLTATVEDVEKKLKLEIDEKLWIQMHHSLIAFGRYFCKAINPCCNECKFKNDCNKIYKLKNI